MATVATNPKQQAHELIDRLSTGQVSAVVGLLEAMLDPASIALANAPYDDEPVTAEEEKSLAEAREWLKHNKGIPHEQVLAELGHHTGRDRQLSGTRVKTIVWTDPARADVRSLSKPIAMHIFTLCIALRKRA